MRLVVLGADGMLGHQLVESMRGRHEVHGTLRLAEGAYSGIQKFLPETVHYGIDVRDYRTVRNLLQHVRPDAVINAVGIIKQRDDARDALASLEVNSLLPHRLAATCAEIGSFLVEISTDCVFSGLCGMYAERDLPDSSDLYGRSKLLGEVVEQGCITFRTSIIGLELSTRRSLIEWFLAQPGPIKGFRKAIYSGFTTREMARIIERVLVAHPRKSGLYHVSSEPIDKFTLLCMLRDRLRRAIDIMPDDEFVCDRSLDSTRFRSEFAYTPPGWELMLDELAAQIEDRYSC
ncbi:MAG: SDR family oxidoreductase [Gemmatimonadaceae bacterium]|nr:SDR family oxidoreductase [Gemmatimonadaceae bacterium]